MRSPTVWFGILVGVCIAAPYLLSVRPRTRLHWVLIGTTITFIALLLPLMVSVRSR